MFLAIVWLLLAAFCLIIGLANFSSLSLTLISASLWLIIKAVEKIIDVKNINISEKSKLFLGWCNIILLIFIPVSLLLGMAF